MKKSSLLLITALLVVAFASAQESQQAEIKFDKITCDFGTFSENDPVQKCTFVFTNVGTAPLIINQAIASCGCTVPAFTKEPIQPGQTGEIKVTYNGRGRFPGTFKKAITVYSNAKTELVRLYITGVMEEGQ